MDEFGADLEEIARTVERAKVLDIQFELLGESLLIDFRAAGTDQPLAVILPKASSRRERMRSVKAIFSSLPVSSRLSRSDAQGSARSRISVIRRPRRVQTLR